jgi:voltage-gated potassium channel
MAIRDLSDSEFKAPPGWRGRLHEVIFGWETRAGRLFDVALILAIFLSVLAVMLESIGEFRTAYGEWIYYAEWSFTVLFTIEYGLRLNSVERPGKYATSFFGIIDLLAIMPTYLSIFFPGAQYLLVIRLLRILRVFRVLKLAKYVASANVIMAALKASAHKIAVFMATVLILVTIVGSLIYFVEGAENGFTSIPRSIYWAIVTVTTVGYGDISPQTILGQLLASMVMLMGYAIIAVPTGIVTVELARLRMEQVAECQRCGCTGHDSDARFCKRCGERIAAT